MVSLFRFVGYPGRRAWNDPGHLLVTATTIMTTTTTKIKKVKQLFIRGDIGTCVTVRIMGLASDKSQEESHTRLQDDTKLKQPNLACRFFAAHHRFVSRKTSYLRQLFSFLVIHLGSLMLLTTFSAELYINDNHDQTSYSCILGPLFQVRTKFFRGKLSGRTIFPGILVPRTTFFARPKFPWQVNSTFYSTNQLRYLYLGQSVPCTQNDSNMIASSSHEEAHMTWVWNLNLLFLTDSPHYLLL